MRKNAEAGQSGGESARDAVRNGEIEGCYPAFAESDQEDGREHEHQKRDDPRRDRHIQLPSEPTPLPPMPARLTPLPEPARSGLHRCKQTQPKLSANLGARLEGELP